LPGHAQTFQEPSHLRGTAADSGQFEDSLARFGNRANRLLFERISNYIAMCGQFAGGFWAFPSVLQAVQPAATVLDYEPFHCGPCDTDDLGGLFPCYATMQQPQCPHPPPYSKIGVRFLLFSHDLLFLVR
jgi:hypothetical protein